MGNGIVSIVLAAVVAAAAVATVKVTEDSLVIGSKAYIFGEVQIADASGPVTFKLHTVNYGKTPAFITEIGIRTMAGNVVGLVLGMGFALMFASFSIVGLQDGWNELRMLRSMWRADFQSAEVLQQAFYTLGVMLIAIAFGLCAFFLARLVIRVKNRITERWP